MIELTINFEETNEKLVCKINGDFDAYNSAEIKKQIKERMENSKATKVVVDMSNVPYIDSAGLGAMVAILKDARHMGKEIVLLALRQNVKRIFEMTRLDKVFRIVDVLEEA